MWFVVPQAVGMPVHSGGAVATVVDLAMDVGISTTEFYNAAVYRFGTYNSR